MFVLSLSYNYILRASTVRYLNTEEWATSANLSTRNSDQAKNLRTKLNTRQTIFIHGVVMRGGHVKIMFNCGKFLVTLIIYPMDTTTVIE